MAHFRNLIPRNLNDEYDTDVAPLADKWKTPSCFSYPGHYRDVIDSLEHSHVIWRLYERRQDVTPFQDICWYFEWIMAGRDMMGCHLLEWVLRQYEYVQTVPRPPIDIEPLALGKVVMAFMEFALHVLSQQNKGDLFRMTSRGAILGDT